MALAGTSEGGRLPVLTWDWRGEWAIVLRALRSPYPYLLTLVAPLALTLAYQAPGTTGVGVGGGYDAPYVRGFHEREERRETGEQYRWTTGASRVLLPGVGAQPSTLVVAAAARPDGTPQPVAVRVNGIQLGEFTPSAQVDRFRFALPAAYYSYGDLTVDLLSETQAVPGKGRTPIPFGPRVAEVRVEPEAGAGWGVKPPLRPLAAWTLIAPLLCLLTLRLGLRPIAAAGVGGAGLAAGAAATAVQRLDLALFAPRLVFLLALAYLLLVGTDLLVPRVFARGGVATDARTWRLLQLIFLLTLTLKLGGIIYPQLTVIDQPWHSQQFEKVLNGRFLEIYRPVPGSISTVPAHWNLQAQIPYPPFLYVVGLPFYLGPLGKGVSLNLWSGLLDVSRVFLVFYLARRLGATARGALFAAFIIGLTASTFLLHSWGNYPTQISHWSAFLFIALTVANWGALRRPPVFIGLLALLTLTMLLYTVTAVFIGVFVPILLAGIAWRGGPDERRGLLPLTAIFAGAALIAFFGYYAQYVEPMVSETLPMLGQGQSLGLAAEGEPFGGYLRRLGSRLAYPYGLLVTFGLAPLGAWTLLRGACDRLTGPVLTAWFSIFFLFVVAGTRIDMVDKEVWFIVPIAAICAGVACDALLRRWPHHGWRFGRALLVALAVVTLFLEVGRRTQPETRVLWLLVPALAIGAAVVADAALRRRPGGQRLDRALVALYLAHLTWSGVTLWLFRIAVVRH